MVEYACQVFRHRSWCLGLGAPIRSFGLIGIQSAYLNVESDYYYQRVKLARVHLQIRSGI